MKIQAAILEQVGKPFRVEEIDLAEPKEGEVLVQVSSAGVCHSDWHLMTGATQHLLPVVPGHEGAGTVLQLGEHVTRVTEGDLVAFNWAPNCGACFYCLNGHPSLCGSYTKPMWDGTLLDGTSRLSWKSKEVFHFSTISCFANYAVVPQEACVRLASEVPHHIAALIGCAVTTGVGAALNTAQVSPGSSVAVFGAGGVGLSIVMGAKLAGASEIIVIDQVESKLTLATQFGATSTVLSNNNFIEFIQSKTEGRGADYAFEAIGIPQVQSKCLEAIRPGGKVILAGISPMGSETNFPGAILARQEKSVLGCYYGSANPDRDFPKYAELYLHNQLPLEKLISKEYSLSEINEAYQDMLEGKVARGILVMEHED